ncbi:MAG: polyribonucleotide nucleotidyltransferase, partial [bacterium]|nr:polyribonucleotide nucleotidyltransferase [bacterium]
MQKKEYALEVGGQKMTAEFNDWADQTNGSVLLRMGNSAVLATVVMSNRESDKNYFPLSVEYEEKFYAAGAILGSRFIRREGRPSDEAILSGRVVDRTIRPLFPKGLKRDVQVIITVLSIEDYDTDILAINAASLAIATSDIPWNGPVSAVRIGRVNGSGFIVNPTYEQRGAEYSHPTGGDPENGERMDLVACGKDGLINMIEVGAHEVSEDVLNDALANASEAIEKIQEWQTKIVSELGKEKQAFASPADEKEVAALFEEVMDTRLAAQNGRIDRHDLYTLKSAWMQEASEKLPDANPQTLDGDFEQKLDEFVHKLAIEKGERVDGRALDEVRTLHAQAGGISPIIHGTGLFYRGATHVLAALTLGGPGDAQLVDTIEFQDAKKTFMLHYNFPPFSVG